MTIVAGVDFGTLSVRVTLVDSQVGPLGTASASYPLHRRRDDPDFATQAHSDHMTALVAATCIVVVPRLQSQTENMTFQFFQMNATAYSGLSDATRLGDLEELKLSSRVVMRVWTDRPQDLRARAYGMNSTRKRCISAGRTSGREKREWG